MKRSIALLVSLAVASPALGQGAAPALTRIGAAAAVKGAVKAQAPGAVGRVVESGKPLFLNDHVTTDAAGRLQVLLLDETVFTLGPNSDMTLDEFVYDPAKQAGKVTARVVKGAFRFVTGKIARRDPENMNVKMPSGTIGIRGTIVLGGIIDGVETVILGGPGNRGNGDDSRGAFTFDGKFVGEPGSGVTCQGGKCSGVQDLSALADKINGLLSSSLDAGNQKTGPDRASATERSGQRTAAAKGGLIEAVDETETQQASNVLLNTAVTDARGSSDGVATWSQLQAAQQLGSVTYVSPTATGVCSGGGCASQPNFQFDFTLNVNFAARTYGGGSSSVQTSGGGVGSDSTNINQTSFAASQGAAAITLLGANHSNSNFNNSTITFLNAGGETAKQAVLNLQYNNNSGGQHASNQSVSGSR